MSETTGVVEPQKVEMVENCAVELPDDSVNETTFEEVDPLSLDEQLGNCNENSLLPKECSLNAQLSLGESILTNNLSCSTVVSVDSNAVIDTKKQLGVADIREEHSTITGPPIIPQSNGSGITNGFNNVEKILCSTSIGPTTIKIENSAKMPRSRKNSLENKLSSVRKPTKSRSNSTEIKQAEDKTKKNNIISLGESLSEVRLTNNVSNNLESLNETSESEKVLNIEAIRDGLRENDVIFSKSPINLDDLVLNDEDDEDESSSGQRCVNDMKVVDIKEEDAETSGSDRDVDHVNSSAKNGEKRTTSPNKRRSSNGSNSSESPSKKLCQEIQKHFPVHDAMLSEYMQNTIHNFEEIQKQTDHLLSEIQTLRELAQAKEIEWNNILHLKKIKEEILLRLLRRKQVLAFEKPSDNSTNSINELNFNYYPKNFTIDRNDEISGLSMKQPHNHMGNSMPNAAVTLPVSFPMQIPPQYVNIQMPSQRPILPKPGGLFPNPKHTVLSNSTLNGRSSYCHQMGRQGPIKDVKSIIADYRQRNPEMAPRRGRRMKSILNPQMINGPRPTAPNFDPKMSELGLLLTTLDAQSREPHNQNQTLPNGVSFKDVLIGFAALQHQQQQQHITPILANGVGIRGPPPHPPPPPYPEISLHPVEENSSSSGSLLHGILTKNNATGRDSPKFTTFSPTLARLLTAPERAPPPTYLQSKNCGEITITPVQPGPSQTQHKDSEVVQLDEDEPEDQADDGGDDAEESDRPLVIDESGSGCMTGNAAGSSNGGASSVPRCQGCHQKDAQFVCAGCANQWYCSRECQVSAWDEHSEHCSG